jgi:hypothetical protein
MAFLACAVKDYLITLDNEVVPVNDALKDRVSGFHLDVIYPAAFLAF